MSDANVLVWQMPTPNQMQWWNNYKVFWALFFFFIFYAIEPSCHKLYWYGWQLSGIYESIIIGAVHRDGQISGVFLTRQVNRFPWHLLWEKIANTVVSPHHLMSIINWKFITLVDVLANYFINVDCLSTPRVYSRKCCVVLCAKKWRGDS